MTLKSDGRGDIQWRLVIEGCQWQWVTHPDLAGDAGDGRTRRFGLMPDGVDMTADLILSTGDVKASSMSLVIEERNDLGETLAFGRRPQVLGWLTVDAESTDTTLTLLDSTPISAGDVIHIGTEAILVDSRPTGTTLDVTGGRGYWQTIAQKHFTIDLERGRYTPVTDAPGALRGRRVYLYSHDPLELTATAAGNLRWRGVLNASPRPIDGVRWSVSVDPITKLLDQEVAADLEQPTTIRGAYYPWNAPFWYRIVEMSGATRDASALLDTTIQRIVGHFETQDALVDALNASLATWTVAMSSTYLAVKDGEGSLHIEVTTPGTGPKYAIVYGGSSIDGGFVQWLMDPDGRTLDSVIASTTYEARLSFADASVPHDAGFPRAWFGHNYRARPEYTDTSVIDTWPAKRIYLARDLGVAYLDGVTIELYAERPDLIEYTFTVGSVSAADRSIDVVEFFTPGEKLTGLTPITAARNYAVNGSIVDFRDGLVAASVNANAGGTPHITSEDMADWSASAGIAVTERGAIAQQRRYIFSKPHTVRDVVLPELLMIGCALTLDSYGKIGVIRMRQLAATETGVGTLDTSIIRAEKGRRSQWGLETGGIVNVVDIEHGYDAAEDSHTGVRYHVMDEHSIALHKERQTATISPLSEEVDTALDYEDAVAIAEHLTAMLGANFQVIDVEAVWLAHGLELGQTVLLTDPIIPNYADGTRGVTNLRCWVIGTSWPGVGTGRVRLLADDQNIAGYAPAARCTAGADNGSDDWTLTVEQNHYAPSGDDDSSFFVVGDVVEVVEFDAFTPGTQTGTVTAITATTIRVQFDGAPPWGGTFSGIFELEFRDDAFSYTPTANEALYAYVANATAVLYTGSAARVFAA